MPSQRSRLIEDREIILRYAHVGAEAADDGTNNLPVGTIIRANEPQGWFLIEHLNATGLVRPNV